LNAYEARQEARRERLLGIAARLKAEGSSRYARAQALASVIPFGQPILVGHHSEGRDRRYREKIHRTFVAAFEADKRAKELERRAESVGTGGISSDDPDAVQKLREQLEHHRAAQARMRAVNLAHKRWLKDPATLATSGLSEADQAHVVSYRPAYTWEPHPYPPYSFHNLSGNIRRIEKRIAQLGERVSEDTPSTVHPCAGYQVVENFGVNRLQLVFPGKPSAAARTLLKRNGYRWSPTEGAWQRMLGGSALYFATDSQGYFRRELEAELAKGGT
jgi:hypothetical protein